MDVAVLVDQQEPTYKSAVRTIDVVWMIGANDVKESQGNLSQQRDLMMTMVNLLHSLERSAAGIGLHVNAHKTEYMCFNQRGDISTLNGSSLKLVDKFTYLRSSVSSTDTDIDTRLAKAWTAFDRLSIGYRSYGSQTWPIKWSAVSSKQFSGRYCCRYTLRGR